MKKRLFTFLMIGAIAAISVKAMAADNITLDASVDIKVPLTLTNATAMSFGTISLPAGTAGTVTLSTAGSVSAGSLAHSGGANGSCTVTGQASSAYTVSTTISHLMNGTNQITLRDITVKCGTAADQTSGIVGNLDASGSQTIAFGGTLDIPADSPSGTYNGSLDVSVAYQ